MHRNGIQYYARNIKPHFNEKYLFSCHKEMGTAQTLFISQTSQYETLTHKTQNLSSRQVYVKEERVVDKVMTIFVLSLFLHFLHI